MVKSRVQAAPASLKTSAFEQLVADLSERFVAAESAGISQCIYGALAEVLRVLDLDRISLTRLNEGTKLFEVIHSCAAPGVEPLHDFTITEEFNWATEQFLSGAGICFSHLEELPAEAAAVARQFDKWGVRSHMTIPMFFADQIVGGFHLASMRRHIVWTPIRPRLVTLARIFTAALDRQRMDTDLRRALAELESLQRMVKDENLSLRQQLESRYEEHRIIGESQALRSSLDRAAKVAATESTVLIMGETGTGKELLAEEIHRRSSRAGGPLIQIDCASLPATLIESELFGYEKGAFSGASQLKKGRLELANGGTLMLDEIGELPDELQVKFLRVLETGKISRLGSTRTMQVDVRLIAATNRNLHQEVAAGRFRSDLFYRISVMPIVLPPLRDRTGDVPLLVWYFIQRLQTKFGRQIETIPEPTMVHLESYDWPGNVRELRNVIERSLILTSGSELIIEELRPDLSHSARPESDDLSTHEREHIRRVLASCDGRIKGPGGAAERLGIKPSTLYYRLKKLGLRS